MAYLSNKLKPLGNNHKTSLNLPVMLKKSFSILKKAL